MSMNYAQIVHDCRRRKPAAWRALYDEFAPMVMGVCHRYCSDDDEANDLLQDTFVKVIEKLGSLRDPQRLRSWIYNIAVNTCIQHFRRRRNTMLSEDLDTIGDIREELPYGMEEIVRALATLPPAQRMAVNLYFIEELTPDEAAGQMGCTPSCFRGMVSKGCAKMREYFNEMK